ncbi:peroxynitrite isomerase THAP4 [Dendroctonus ponderosae]|uniref:THAP4-like heme-binding domain-containing protein n=1 Tax=Dendroctonus ponderosae TaxID=77166 RepID=U4UEG8_DENPD|nr:peroxynitrite isomerase THAP4 [Dendroctonus ponderosae]ERL92339.1 hypothetical protein D910_09656 [Dendroctonus ponderosae]KAH1015423.1 hypothetical protein HUJ05_013148 [Dendroctonus ponderosae]
MTTKGLHAVLRNLHWLVGKWTSISAEVSYPTMQKVIKFDEVLEFKFMGQPLLTYSSVTTNPQNKGVMHLENGFLRVDEDQCTLAFLTAMNFGLASLEEGYVKGNTVVLASACLGIMKFAKQSILAIHRCYRLNDKGELEYTLLMETPQTPLTLHVEAVYRKECTESADKKISNNDKKK